MPISDEKKKMFEAGRDVLLKGIDLCSKEKLLGPALKLVYSTIDAMANLYSAGRLSTNEGSGRSFRKWVRDFLLAEMYRKDVNDNDFWGARCGLLHSYEPVSSESQKGTAKEIFYFLRSPGTLAFARKLAQVEKGKGCIVLFMDRFLDAIRRAIAEFEKWLAGPDSSKENLARKLKQMFVMCFKVDNQGRLL